MKGRQPTVPRRGDTEPMTPEREGAPVAMNAAASSRPLVVLRSGVSVTREAVQLLWALEARGLTMRLDGSSLVVTGLQSQFTLTDLLAIRAHTDELVALVHVRAEEAM